MFREGNWREATSAWMANKDLIVMIKDLMFAMSFEEYMDFLHKDRKTIFMIDEPEDLPDPEEEHTDAEFEALFEEVPPEALEEAKAHLTRAQKRHMIETLYAQHPELSVGEIAERVGVSAATVRRHIK